MLTNSRIHASLGLNELTKSISSHINHALEISSNEHIFMHFEQHLLDISTPLNIYISIGEICSNV